MKETTKRERGYKRREREIRVSFRDGGRSQRECSLWHHGK